MTATISGAVAPPPQHTKADVRLLVTEAVAEARAGMALAELSDEERGGYYKALIDQAIAWMAQTGEKFSANDIRELLPGDLPAQGLMGARFQHAANNLGLIQAVSGVPSTKKNTHGKPIALWVGTVTSTS